MTEKNYVSRAPWSLQPSLKEMAEEVGIDFDDFISGLKHNKNDMELAEDFGVSKKTIHGLREHFEKFGVHSIMGQD